MQAVRFAWWQGPGRVPLSNLDRRQGRDDPQAGKQAEHFFDRLAAEAGRAGVAVDVVAVGQAAVNVPLLGPLAQKTGGLVTTHQRELCSLCLSCQRLPSPAAVRCQSCCRISEVAIHSRESRLDLSPGLCSNMNGTSFEHSLSG